MRSHVTRARLERNNEVISEVVPALVADYCRRDIFTLDGADLECRRSPMVGESTLDAFQVIVTTNADGCIDGAGYQYHGHHINWLPCVLINYALIVNPGDIEPSIQGIEKWDSNMHARTCNTCMVSSWSMTFLNTEINFRTSI